MQVNLITISNSRRGNGSSWFWATVVEPGGKTWTRDIQCLYSNGGHDWGHIAAMAMHIAVSDTPAHRGFVIVGPSEMMKMIPAQFHSHKPDLTRR